MIMKEPFQENEVADFFKQDSRVGKILGRPGRRSNR
jgi:hypothetical protein